MTMLFNYRRSVKYLLWAFCTALVFVILNKTLKEDFGDNAFKVQQIERLIRTDSNTKMCKIPDLPVNNPEILQFYTDSEPIDCGKEADWVVCEESICYVKPEVIAQHGDVTCSYYDIVRKTDYKVKYGRLSKTSGYYYLKSSDFAKASCRANDGTRWTGLIIGIRELEPPVIKNKFTQSYYNVLMFGLDSMSHNAFIRKLPRSYAFLKDTLKAVILNGYNIVGDGTPQALIPILTGKTELELPEVRKRFSGSSFLDVYPMIWKEYEQQGYLTAFHEDLPKYGTFTYRMNGFDKQPTHHYMRSFYLELQNTIDSYEKYCIGGEKGHNVMLNYTKNFMLKYRNHPKFAFSFHGELSHDSVNLVGAADEDILSWLQTLNNRHILDDTILIVMSDHGNRFAEVRNTIQGKQEERLPFFSFTIPDKFKSQHPEAYQNLVQNSNRLTTPFDVHETLVDILRLQSSNREVDANYHKQRSISLFNKISENRSCADAYIEPHWCSCLDWKRLTNTESAAVKNAANSILEAINDYTQSYRSLCSALQLSKINWVLKLEPHSELLQFKQNKDTDGFVADLSASMKIKSEKYQLQIMLLPGNSIFEASVDHELKTNTFKVNIAEISRVNKYGSQANCIYDLNPELRKYCYCGGHHET